MLKQKMHEEAQARLQSPFGLVRASPAISTSSPGWLVPRAQARIAAAAVEGIDLDVAPRTYRAELRIAVEAQLYALKLQV